MNILLSINNTYVDQLIVLCHSLFQNNDANQIHIFLMHSELTQQNLEKIERFVVRHSAKFSAVKVDKDLFQDAPSRVGVSVETYYRLLAFQILDVKIERILYLDVDMIVTADLSTMYFTAMRKKIFAAVPDQGDIRLARNHWERIGMTKGQQYVNAGVLLINLKAMREKTSQEQIFSYIEKKKKSLRFQDQDVINGLFGNEIVYLPSYYNKAALYQNFYDLITYPIRYLLGMDRPKGIIHYMGPRLKPWRSAGYGNKYFYEYYHYSKLTECEQLRKQIEKNRKTRLKCFFDEFGI